MYAVSDDLAGHTRVGEEDADGPGVSVKQGRHGVEEVGGHGGTGIDGSARGIAVRCSMTDRGKGTAIDDDADRIQGTRKLGGKSHHPDAPLAHIEDARHLVGVGQAQRCRVVGPAVGAGDPRPLEVDAAQRAVVDEGDERAHLADQVVVLRRDEARVHRRRAVGAVRGRGCGDFVSVGGGEGGASAAVAVEVHEAGHQGVGANSLSGGCTRTDLHDRVALDPHPGIRPLAVGIDDALRGEHERHAPTLGHPNAG